MSGKIPLGKYGLSSNAAFDAGLKGDVAFCEANHSEWDAHHLDMMLCGAAQGGHGDLCRSARALGSTAFRAMAMNAAKGHQITIVHLALEWVEVPDSSMYDVVLGGAAEGGHEDLCIFAKVNGAKLIDNMLWRALMGGHLKLCDLAIEWKAKKFQDAFMYAAMGGSVDACVYVKNVLLQTNFGKMRSYAKVCGHDHLVALADEWKSSA